MEAGKIPKQNKEEGIKFIHVYKLKAKILLDLCWKYPLFRRFLLLRAT